MTYGKDMMNYRDEVLRTLNQKLNPDEIVVNATLGLTGEAGELANVIKKIMFHGHDVNDKMKEQLMGEMGDCYWYLEVLSEMFGFEEDDIKKANVEKLRKRYPDGFSEDRSINREV